MGIDVRQLLFDHGFVRCDRCVGWVMLPRWLAVKRGWHCDGILGHYDYCKKCAPIMARHQEIYDGRVFDGSGCWAGEDGRPGVECRREAAGPSGLCKRHIEELIDG